MEKASEWAKDQNADRLYVEAFWGNNKAIKYYKNNGFVEIGVELELLSKNLEQQIILLAVLTATVSPLLFRIFNKYSKV